MSEESNKNLELFFLKEVLIEKLVKIEESNAYQLKQITTLREEILELKEETVELKKEISKLEAEVGRLKAKMSKIYGFASGIGASIGIVVGLITYWVKSVVFGGDVK